MKTKTGDLSELYLGALRTHLAQDSSSTMESARDMGQQALELGFETLDLAKIHESTVAVLVSPESSSAQSEDVGVRAAVFFTEAITSIEKTHAAALEADKQLRDVTETLEQRTRDLADSNSDLKDQITGRQTAEAALSTSEQSSRQLLKDSLRLEEHLQDLARKLLSANEEVRRKMSLHLHDEIAQTLLGIHVRLLALKRLTAVSSASLDQEIENIQRLVQESTHITHRLTREFGV